MEDFIMKNIIFCISVCIVSYQFSFAQNTDDRFHAKPDREIKQPYCEFNVPELERIAAKIESNKYLIIVSHPERTERKSISSRRLYNAREFFKSSPYDRPTDSILIAEGEPITGYGYVDFFVEGKLELRIHVNKNAELVVTACVIDPPNSRCSNSHELLFYPCLSKKTSMR